jgi:hypothetical protein
MTAVQGRLFTDQVGVTAAQAWGADIGAVCGLLIEGVYDAMLTRLFFGKLALGGTLTPPITDVPRAPEQGAHNVVPRPMWARTSSCSLVVFLPWPRRASQGIGTSPPGEGALLRNGQHVLLHV